MTLAIGSTLRGEGPAHPARTQTRFTREARRFLATVAVLLDQPQGNITVRALADSPMALELDCGEALRVVVSHMSRPVFDDSPGVVVTVLPYAKFATCEEQVRWLNGLRKMLGLRPLTLREYLQRSHGPGAV